VLCRGWGSKNTCHFSARSSGSGYGFEAVRIRVKQNLIWRSIQARLDNVLADSIDANKDIQVSRRLAFLPNNSILGP
jgi:hypothetical protein